MGALDRLKVTREPQDLVEIELLNHCTSHRTSFLCAVYLEEEHFLQVCRSGAGFYLGVVSPQGEPLSRDSEYWATAEEAAKALEDRSWTQRMNP